MSQLTISYDASPNLHQAALVMLPDDAESGFFPVTYSNITRWDPEIDLDWFLRYRADNYDEDLVAGATILGMEANSCPGGVTWALDSSGVDGVPPDMGVREINDGLALLEYKLEDTPNGAGYDPDGLPYAYEYVRAVAACRDANGDTMVTYRSRRFMVLVMAGEAA